ncbi:MAG: ribosome silencing factor [Christensenellaceae bacterium]|jgi:ribosome-associated protein
MIKKEEISNKALHIADILDSKKAQDIIILKVEDLTIISDYFVVAGATSNTHAQTLAEEVEHKMAQEQEERPTRIEGMREGRWIVLDYGEVLVHIFHKEEREFYQLERLWKVDDNFFEYADKNPETGKAN